jgi:putative transposase
MSSKYKVGDDAIGHFITFLVVGWIDVFTLEQYKEIFTQSLQACVEHKGLLLHAWVIMTNHGHLIISSDTAKLEHLVRDIKKFTSKQIIKTIQENEKKQGSMDADYFFILPEKIITIIKNSSFGNRTIML